MSKEKESKNKSTSKTKNKNVSKVTKKKTIKEKKPEGLYAYDGDVKFFKTIPYGLQHVLSMFVSNIVPIIIIGGVCNLSNSDLAKLIQVAMIFAGLGTLLQLFPIWKIGSRMPMVLGVSFTFVTAFTYIGVTHGFGAVLGACLCGGLVELLLGLTCKFWRKLITPVVSACVVISIGMSLFTVGAQSFGGGSNVSNFGDYKYLIIGFITLITCIIFNVWGKGFMKNLSILFGMIAGYIASVCFGIIDFSSITSSSIIAIPKVLPYDLVFVPSAIVSAILIFLVSTTEAIGDFSALSENAFNREVSEKELGGGIACDGFMSMVASLFGCLPLTSFSQNVGLVGMTKIVNRKAIASGALVLIIAGLFPIFSNILATVPDSVLGGCTIMLFGTIVITGMKMLSKAGFTERNLIISSLALSMGVGFTNTPGIFNEFPELIRGVFEGNCVALVFVIALVLNLILPKEKIDYSKYDDGIKPIEVKEDYR